MNQVHPGRASGVFSLGLANGLALLSAVAAATLYARWLDATELATCAIALALARAGLLLLDGGLKTALVRREVEAAPLAVRQLTHWCTAAALLMTLILGAVLAGLWSAGHLASGPALLCGASAAAYWLSYPPLFGALARLERAQRFGAIGRAEGASVATEAVLPMALLAAGVRYEWAFALAAVLGRALRTVAVLVAARRLPTHPAPLSPPGPVSPLALIAPLSPLAPRPPRPPLAPSSSTTSGSRTLLHEGSGVQAVAVLAMLRDHLHLWLLAPWFGAAWAGAYALALTACALVCQVAVQTSTRVSLPLLRATPAAQQWPAVLAQARRLAIVCLPPLALLPAWLAWADTTLWADRWHDTLAVAPWWALRMVAGIGTSVVGAWLLVARAPWINAAAHARWTVLEVSVAAAALALAGPLGLAWAAAATGWAGLALFLAAATPTQPVWPRWAALAAALCLRPGLALALLLATWVHSQPQALPVATALLPLAWLTEPSLRRWLAAKWAQRRTQAARAGTHQAGRPAAPRQAVGDDAAVGDASP